MTTIIKNKAWEDLQLYDWVADMKGVPQSPVFHAEGDVAIHTRMVLAELEALAEYPELSHDEQEIVWTACLMHDIEKRSTTQTDVEGNIVSPGHSRKGSLTANAILYRYFDVPFHMRQHIVALIRYHGLPIWSLGKEDPAKAVIKAGLELDTKLLYIVAKADVLGRICPDKAQLLEQLEYFRELCLENGSWGNHRQFATDQAMFSYFRKNDQSPDHVPFEHRGSNVILMSGMPGSGKDHYLSTVHPKLPVISLDDMRRAQKIDRNDSKGNGRIIQQAIEQAKKHLRNGDDFAWNATNITLQMREQLIDQFAVYNAKVRIVYIEVPYKKLMLQNRKRDFPIPESAIERMIDKLECPKRWEAHQVEYRV